MSWRQIVTIVLTMALATLPSSSALAQDPCAGNRVANASFEDGSHSDGNGLPASSVVGNGWSAWSVWGGSSGSRQAEFDVENNQLLGRYSAYREHSGHFSQKFSTAWGTHNAGVYQRIAVPKGSTVTFSAWVQIYTGEETQTSNGEQVSDLNHPGNYRAYVGIDPFGDEPGRVGSPPSPRTVWCDPVIDRDTRRFDSQNRPYDAWVQIKVTTKAQADHATVFVRGEPEFGVHNNVSYWDDACLSYVPPKAEPTATPAATSAPAPTPPPSPTAAPSPTAVPPTATPQPTEPPTATPAAAPTEPPTLAPTALPTSMAVPTELRAAPTPTCVAPTSETNSSTDNPLLLFAFVAVWLSAAGYLGWSLWHGRGRVSG